MLEMWPEKGKEEEEYNKSIQIMIALFLSFFLESHLQHIKVPRLGVESELQLGSTPQPQQ